MPGVAPPDEKEPIPGVLHSSFTSAIGVFASDVDAPLRNEDWLPGAVCGVGDEGLPGPDVDTAPAVFPLLISC